MASVQLHRVEPAAMACNDQPGSSEGTFPVVTGGMLLTSTVLSPLPCRIRLVRGAFGPGVGLPVCEGLV